MREVSSCQFEILNVILNFYFVFFPGMLDRQSLKSSLLPKIRTVCMTTSLLSVRVNSLICVGKLLEHMDKWQVIDDVLSWMPQIPSKEPAVIMAIVGIFKLAVSSSKLGLTKEEMANKALPFLIPLSIENGLTVQQFNIIVSLIKDMVAKVEAEHRTKLEQLHAIQDTQAASLQSSLAENMTLSSGKLVAAPSAGEAASMDSMFSGMGLGDYVNTDKSKLVNTVIGGDKPGGSGAAASSNIPKSASSLTLQEKKQMMQSQEKSSKPSPSPTPVNLTDSLMNKSLSMNTMSGSSQAWNSNSNSSGWSSAANSNISNITQASGSSWGPSPSQHQQTAQGFGGFTPAPMMPPAQPQQQRAKPDLSAFDNLLSPSSSAQAKQPMSSMMGGE